MKLTTIVWQRIHQPDFGNEEENWKAKILFSVTNAGIIALVMVIGI